MLDFSSIGGFPGSNITYGIDDFIFGSLPYDNDLNHGLIYKIRISGEEMDVIHKFNDFEGEGRYPRLLSQDADGTLYGITSAGGPNGYGVIYKIDPDGSGFQKLHEDFDNTSYSSPNSGLLISSDDFLYGITTGGSEPYEDGSILKIRKDGSDFEIIYSFDDEAGTGQRPVGGLIEDQSGYLYGVTSTGGINTQGVIFKVKKDGTHFSALHSFMGTDGSSPNSRLLLHNEVLYGITPVGGASDQGVAFSIKIDGSEFEKLFDFFNSDGESPSDGLILNELPTGSIDGLEVFEDSDPITVDLYKAFQDSETPDEYLRFEIFDNSNSTLFSSVDIEAGTATLSLEDDQFGASTVTIRCFDGMGDYVDTNFSINVLPLIDNPNISSTSTTYGMLSSTGLVISKNENDGNEVANFKITGIENGILYKNDGTTIINNGDFISVEDGLSGLIFLPKIVGELNFTVQSSSSAEDSDLGGNPISSQITVSKAPLEITAIDKTIAYGDGFDFEATISGFVFEANEDNLSGTLTFAEIGSTVAGDYPKGIIPMGLSSDNYEIAFLPGDLSIDLKKLEVQANNETITYGDVLTGFSVVFSGFAFDDDENSLDGTQSFEKVSVEQEGVGIYNSVIIPSGLSSDNYEITFFPGDLIINKKDLIVSVVEKIITYGDTNPLFELEYSGFAFDENESILGGTLSFDNIIQSNVGNYENVVIAYGLSSGNYQITFMPGDLTIDKKI